jgi:hypothetical protein
MERLAFPRPEHVEKGRRLHAKTARSRIPLEEERGFSEAAPSTGRRTPGSAAPDPANACAPVHPRSLRLSWITFVIRSPEGDQQMICRNAGQRRSQTTPSGPH